MNLQLEKLLRNYISLKLYLIRDGNKKAKFLREKRIFKKMGTKCYYHSNYLPAEPFLVSIGDNVAIAAGVRMITHSIQHIVFNNEDDCKDYRTEFGPIDIGNNVFIGADSIIMFGTSIGNNVIVAAGAVVTKDVPDNSVVAGVPGRVIGTYEEVKKKNYSFSRQFDGVSSNRVCDLNRYLEGK